MDYDIKKKVGVFFFLGRRIFVVLECYMFGRFVFGRLWSISDVGNSCFVVVLGVIFL